MTRNERTTFNTSSDKDAILRSIKAYNIHPSFVGIKNHVKNPKEFPFKNIGKKSDEKIKR